MSVPQADNEVRTLAGKRIKLVLDNSNKPATLPLDLNWSSLCAYVSSRFNMLPNAIESLMYMYTDPATNEQTKYTMDNDEDVTFWKTGYVEGTVAGHELIVQANCEPAVSSGWMGAPHVVKAKIAAIEEKLEVMQIRSLNDSNRGHTTDADWYKTNGTHVVPLWFSAFHKKDAKRIFIKKLISTATDNEWDDIQPRWSKYIIPEINKLNLKVTLVDLFTTKSVGSRKPDCPGYMAGKPRNEFYSVVVGDIKGGRSKDSFTPQEKGKIGGFLNRVIVETKRAFACGFLTDGRIIQFFRFRNGELEETNVYLLKDDGESLLLGFLNCDIANNGVEIGEVYTNQREVLISSHLGIGAHSIVWKGIYLRKEVVIKKFTRNQELLRHEVEILKTISNVPNVAQLEAETTSDPMAILLSPIGVHFIGTPATQDTKAVFRMCHFVCLIDTLYAVHKLGIIHGDVKPSNFFQYKSDPDKLFVNDWSSAQWIERDEQTSFSGTRLYATEQYLRDPNHYSPAPLQDLEAAVKSLYVVMHSEIFYSQFYNKEQCEDRGRILAFWERALVPEHWQRLLDAARRCDYSTMLAEAERFVQIAPFP